MLFLTGLMLAATAQAHYRFSKIVINGTPEAQEWTAVRQTKNFQGNQGVTSVSSADMRCYQNKAGTATATIAAGETLGFVANAMVSHFGPLQFYMARVPDSANINTWEASGNVWFKVASISAVQGNGPLTSDEQTWPAYSTSFTLEVLFSGHVADGVRAEKTVVDFKVPKNVPSGKYLVRVESIALHQAQSVGGAQIYLSCAQVEVTNGGTGTPGPLVAFPGAYSANDPGLLWSYYPVATSYKAPGPAVWTG
ncbi:fungal cellulose binding domain-containing protein [Paraphaeosphaeria sporulosa]